VDKIPENLPVFQSDGLVRFFAVILRWFVPGIKLSVMVTKQFVGIQIFCYTWKINGLIE